MKNELGNESSPYLLQHAHNPVWWQPWSKAALEAAARENKPVLVSIGYSACHWCHVMERESFENEAVAEIMNREFINIKIDREERPDLDHIYMDAVQAISGSGGWPLNVFLTPDGKPFYGGTYFPPQKAFNRASWTDVLQSVSDAWKNRRAEMEAQAENLSAHIASSGGLKLNLSLTESTSASDAFTADDCRAIADALMAKADKIEGGFGAAPKFPQTFSINCLLQASYFLNEPSYRAQAELSISKMLDGGIYDQLGGGLCRYSTDNEWLAPHFEKMLYDNALFIISLSAAFSLTKKEKYRAAINDIYRFLLNEMRAEDGGFNAALDADSEGVEGRFYTWEKEEIDAVLGNDAPAFSAVYDVTERGNFSEGGSRTNILRRVRSVESVAAEFAQTVAEVELLIERSKEKLLSARAQRVRPGTDDKIILGWNALLLTAFCKAFAALQDDRFLRAAEELYAFLNRAFVGEAGEMYHTYKNGVARYPAFLDDYAYWIEAQICLQEITGREVHLHNARTLAESVVKNFYDEVEGFFFFTPQGQEDISIRKKEIYDGAVPSGNAVMAKNMLYLSTVFDDRQMNQRALAMIYSLKNIVAKYPGSFGIWASAVMNQAAGINETSVIGKDKMLLLMEMLPEYVPNRILIAGEAGSSLPILAGKVSSDDTVILVCRNFTCKAPFKSAAEAHSAMQPFAF